MYWKSGLSFSTTDPLRSQFDTMSPTESQTPGSSLRLEVPKCKITPEHSFEPYQRRKLGHGAGAVAMPPSTELQGGRCQRVKSRPINREREGGHKGGQLAGRGRRAGKGMGHGSKQAAASAVLMAAALIREDSHGWVALGSAGSCGSQVDKSPCYKIQAQRLRQTISHPKLIHTSTEKEEKASEVKRKQTGSNVHHLYPIYYDLYQPRERERRVIQRVRTERWIGTAQTENSAFRNVDDCMRVLRLDVARRIDKVGRLDEGTC
ncbi:hypothetical protein DFH07DRAFT_784341 [Mycena maculata]|uniref:Uncharacterized protein n=1 Tax=Mycena maculata TaxID=230809 RepID=A0AAD7MKI5_9AGAR|nr:hypothetical protein DFH07DRAFT_784341 [Mycena maculata]